MNAKRRSKLKLQIRQIFLLTVRAILTTSIAGCVATTPTVPNKDTTTTCDACLDHCSRMPGDPTACQKSCVANQCRPQ
jgi:hypothetical protein